MENTTANNNSFQIGLCMAGAISAGAYTAGVMDYLIEALEEWEKRKASGDKDVPSHKVEIPVIGGASAGGMTGIIASAAIHDNIPPIKQIDQNNLLAKQPSNKFYHSWVDLTQDDMFPELLKNDDIDGKKTVCSVLNASFIDEIANRALLITAPAPVKRPYIPEHLKVFTTLSNLQGLKFNVAFRSNAPETNKYIIGRHNDYACFKLADTQNEYNRDGWVPLNFANNVNTDMAKNAAMATGAFPVGLKARRFSRDSKYVNDLNWFFDITRTAGCPVKEPKYDTINVDGGLINNEPFERVRELLCDITGETKETYENYNSFKSTVLMIDPFPSEPGVFKNSDALTTVIGNTLGAMIDHLRTKPATLVAAMNSDNAGQYLISPRRKLKTGNTTLDLQGSKAIACGTLDGFGGFLDKQFRIHDYFLGRANCEKFLRDHFTVPATCSNSIFAQGYSAVSDKTPFTAEDGSLQIIPIFTKKTEGMYMPTFNSQSNWPVISEQDIDRLRPLIKSRAEKVLFKLTHPNWLQTALLWIGAKIVINGKIADSVIELIKDSLKEHKLLK